MSLEKKQVPLRISKKLYDELVSWSENDFRSLNGQIEYILNECVKQRKRNGKYAFNKINNNLDADITKFEK